MVARASGEKLVAISCFSLASYDSLGARVSAHVVGVGASKRDELLFGRVATRAGLAVEQQYLIFIFDAAGPVGFDFAQRQIDCDRQMPGDELAGRAHIDDERAMSHVLLCFFH